MKLDQRPGPGYSTSYEVYDRLLHVTLRKTQSLKNFSFRE